MAAYVLNHLIRACPCAVVALFNAIGKARAEKDAEAAENADENKEDGNDSKKRKRKEKVDKKTELKEKKQQIKNLSKDMFLNSLRADASKKSKESDKKPAPMAAKPEKWSALRDDFMMDKGIKLKVPFVLVFLARPVVIIVMNRMCRTGTRTKILATMLMFSSGNVTKSFL
jgi:hypothetical protein